MKSKQTEILIIGGGVTGLTTAWLAAEQGRKVVLLDRQTTGQEASWAGAGMLPPGNLSRATTPEARLRSYSHSLWPQFASRLRETTGLDNGYLRCGSVYLETEQNSVEWQKQVALWQDEGLAIELLNESECRQRLPAVGSAFRRGCCLRDFAQVRNPRHLKALKSACLQAGVLIEENQAVTGINYTGDRVLSVATADSTYYADHYCVTAGSWSAQLLQQFLVPVPIVPVRGQICQLRVSELPFRTVLEVGRRYLVPRPDGLILVGSTEEQVGFHKANTASAIAELLQFATNLVPALGSADVARTWSGLRPGTPDELPLLGRVGNITNLIIAAGHFRSGLQMSAGTARIIVDLIHNKRPEISLDGLTANRFTESSILT